VQGFHHTVLQIIRQPRTQILCGFFFVLVISLVGISDNTFWEDEANTALFARNLIHQGQLTAWDGSNVIGYIGGYELNQSLQNVIIPPLQYYVAAAGMLIFGETELGAHMPSVILGALSILVLGWASKGFISERAAQGIPAVVAATSAAMLLFIPHARYFSASLFFATLILGLWANLGDRNTAGQNHFVLKSVIGMAACSGLFYSNYYMAPAMVACLVPLMLFPKFRTRQHKILIALLSVNIFLMLGYVLTDATVLYRLEHSDPLANPLMNFMLLLKWHIFGLSAFEFMPFLLVPFLMLPGYLGGAKPCCPIA